jgi:hypothetical protein
MGRSIHFERGSKKAVLSAGPRLQTLPDSVLFFKERNCRHPLGIYNVSIGRIVQRGLSFSELLWRFFCEVTDLNTDYGNQRLVDIDNELERLTYALAEHIDDCESILKTCFRTDEDFSRSKSVREFKKAITPLRREFCFIANAIKHNQQRLRFVEIEFYFLNNKLLLLGFFLEKIVNGVVCADPHLIGGGKKVSSVVAYVWRCIIRLVLISIELEKALHNSKIAYQEAAYPWDDHEFQRFAIMFARLPAYMFEDQNPFTISPVTVLANDREIARQALPSSLYLPPSRCVPLGPSQVSVKLSGDGVSKSFEFAHPAEIHFVGR